MRIHNVCGVIVAVLLAGCQAPPDRSVLPETAKSQIKSTAIVVRITQKQIDVAIPDTNYALAVGGGAIPGAIDSSVKGARTKDAEEAVAPLRKALVGYDFDQVLAAQMKAALPEQSWLHTSGAKVAKDDDLVRQEVVQSGADAVLVVSVDYQLAFYGNQLIVRMTAGLYPKTASLNALRSQRPSSDALAPGNTIYRGIFAFYKTIPAPNASGDRASYLAAWTADNGAAMRSAMDNAAADLARRLAADIGLPPVAATR